MSLIPYSASIFVFIFTLYSTRSSHKSKHKSTSSLRDGIEHVIVSTIGNLYFTYFFQFYKKNKRRKPRKIIRSAFCDDNACHLRAIGDDSHSLLVSRKRRFSQSFPYPLCCMNRCIV